MDGHRAKYILLTLVALVAWVVLLLSIPSIGVIKIVNNKHKHAEEITWGIMAGAFASAVLTMFSGYKAFMA